MKFLLALAALAAARAETPTVLNLSHDLTTYAIASQNMTPNSPAVDSRPLFQVGVLYASKNHIPTVTVDRGSYYFLTLNSPYQHVYLEGIANVTIDLKYSDLYFAKGNIEAFNLVNPVNVTLRNFTIDYLQLPFTQVTVTSVNPTARTIGFQKLGNYPLPSIFNSLTVPPYYVNDGYYAFVFRGGQQLRTTGWMQASGPFNANSLQITGSDPWAQPAQIATIQAGDTLVLEWRAGIGAIWASGATGLTVHNVSIYASGFIGVFVGSSSGTTVDHVQIIPRPATDRMISTNADGIHLASAGANNVISNNTVRRGCDDAIAIDGQWAAIVNASNNGATVQVARHNDGALPIGAAFDFIDITSAAIVGTAKIVAENPPPAAQTGADEETITLTLDHAINGLKTNFGVTPNDPQQRGAGTIISGNLVQEETFARGIYPAGVANVTITDNMVQATNQSGILVEQDEGLIYNYKTGPSSGIAIKNNIVDHALGFGVPSNPLMGFAGAINVVAYDEYFNWVSTSSMTNISITGNFVTNSPVAGIRMENVSGGQLSGNTILNYGQQPNDYLWYLPGCCETTAQIEADLQKPWLIVNSASVTSANNTTTGSWVANRSNADGGFRLAPGSIAVAYGQNFVPSTVSAPGQPLPASLGGLTVTVKDSAGATRTAGLYYVSSGQVAYVVPAGTAPGVATVTVGGRPSGALIGAVGPGILAANGTNSGVALAGAVRTAANGAQVYVPVFQCSETGCASVPIDLGAPSDAVAVTLYGTGIRGNSGLANVAAQIGGVPAEVTYAGVQGQYDGLDQVNVTIPRSLQGAGEVPVILTVDGITANVVTVNVK